MHMCVRPLTVVQMQREAKGVWTVGGIGVYDDRLGCWSAAVAHLAVYILRLRCICLVPFPRARALFSSFTIMFLLFGVQLSTNTV